jgi:hypothetical protein
MPILNMVYNFDFLTKVKGKAEPVINVWESERPRPLYPRPTRAGLDVVDENNPCLRRKPNPGRPARSPTPFRLLTSLFRVQSMSGLQIKNRGAGWSFLSYVSGTVIDRCRKVFQLSLDSPGLNSDLRVYKPARHHLSYSIATS